jgi:hypothetical protein
VASPTPSPWARTSWAFVSEVRAEQDRVTERIGLDLILPLAAMLPFERHIRWVRRKQVPAKVVRSCWTALELWLPR